MQYAVVDGARIEAAPGLRGECPHCGSVVLSKCGKFKVWHWSHVGKKLCDPWWEPETEWHRNWKGRFPAEWHEVGHLAPDGERHVADLKAPHGLVIEFQHSAIADDERMARTNFYGNMVWVVDGLRRKRDRIRASRSTPDWRMIGERMWALGDTEEALPREWLDCAVPVFFDFGTEEVMGTGDPAPQPAKLWCLLPSVPGVWQRNARYVIEISVDDFVAKAQAGHPVPGWADFLYQQAEIRREQQLALNRKAEDEAKRLRHYRWARRTGAHW